MRADEGCEAVVITRTRCERGTLMDGGNVVSEWKKDLPKAVRAVNKSHARPARVYGKETWCEKESNKEIWQRTE